jgi:hypothetical protein
MNFVLIYCFFLFLILSFYSVGNFSLKLIFKKELSFYSKNVLFGYVILTILLYFSYFFLKIKSFYIITIVLFLIFYSFYYSLKDIKKNFKNIFFFISIKSLLILIFFIPAYSYGEQFYIFRGNYWDSFNYLSSALLFNLTEYKNITDTDIYINFQSFQSIKEIITYRPFINYFLSIFLYLKTVDIFLLYYSFKIFLILLIFTSIFNFLEIFKELNNLKKTIISTSFCLCFFSLYIFEIDALSHLGSLSILIFALKNLIPFLESIQKKKAIKNIVFNILILASLFIIYPEIFIFYSLILISFTLVIFIKKPKIFFYKNILLCLVFFLMFTLISFKTNYVFLLIQINQSLSSLDWWGYYGAFILGRDNLVTDSFFVERMVNLLKNTNLIEAIIFVFVNHFEAGYYFFIFNFLPSLFGLYYLTIGKLEGIFSFILLIFTIFINFYILNKIYKTLKHFFLNKNYEILISFFCIVLLMVYFIIIGSVWTAIKIYSYTLLFLYLFLVIDFKSKKIDYFILVCLLIFPLYKYSAFNHGIGVEDAFPSIIDNKYKKQINWGVTKQRLINCNSVYVNIDDYFINSYIKIKSIYYKKNIIYVKNKNVNHCVVSIKNKNFNIRIINE